MSQSSSRWKEGQQGPWYGLSGFGSGVPTRFIEDSPFIKGVSFRKGLRIDAAIEQPLEYTLYKIDPEDGDSGPFMPAVFLRSVPLFRQDLVQCMQDFGVDNLQLFDAEIYDPENDKTYTNYKAVNVVGIIEIYDRETSKKCRKGHMHFDAEKLENTPKDLFIAQHDYVGSVPKLRNELVDHILDNGFEGQLWFSHFRNGLFFDPVEQISNVIEDPNCFGDK